ncbi:MAG: hypothetical protein P4L10_07220 [Acidobacteriaceae bacterium]|nr:hypothetical protein [Acidobacteriaceae bacterium]
MNIIGKRLQVRALTALANSSKRSMLSGSDTFMNGANIGYAEQMYEDWKKDPKTVHASWDAYFTNLARGVTPAFVCPPTLGSPATAALAAPAAGLSSKAIEEHLKVLKLVNAYQLKGHEIGEFDPLSMSTGLTTHDRAQC